MCSGIEQLETRALSAEAELAQIKAIIQDPVAVHVNMLRGTIAIPSLSQYCHAAGIENPEADNARMRSVLERCHQAITQFQELFEPHLAVENGYRSVEDFREDEEWAQLMDDAHTESTAILSRP